MVWVFWVGLLVFSLGYFYWGFKNLTGEGYQFLAVIPLRKRTDGSWASLNLTYYGFLSANAVALGLITFLVLTAGLGSSVWMNIIFFGMELMLALPAARLFSRLVENKKHAFTTQGAFLMGTFVAIPALFLLNPFADMFGVKPLPIKPTLAALSIAYCLSEGWGRLACVSFGCCYGKPIDQCPRWIQALFRNHPFVFRGKTKKIAYAHGWEGVPMLPVQAITSCVYFVWGMVAMAFFLTGYFAAGFWISMIASQGWRFASEFLRSDARGDRKITLYQLSTIAILISCAVAWPMLPQASLSIDWSGIHQVLETPVPVLVVLFFWILTFLYMGKSRVTGAWVSFHVREERI